MKRKLIKGQLGAALPAINNTLGVNGLTNDAFSSLVGDTGLAGNVLGQITKTPGLMDKAGALMSKANDFLSGSGSDLIEKAGSLIGSQLGNITQGALSKLAGSGIGSVISGAVSNLGGKAGNLLTSLGGDKIGNLLSKVGGSTSGGISPNVASLASIGMDLGAKALGFKAQKDTNYGLRNTISGAVMAFNPAAGLGMKAMSMINEAAGTSVNQYNKAQRDFAGVNKLENIGNQVLGTALSFSPLGLLTGLRKNTNDSVMSQEFQEEGANSWAGSYTDAQTAQTMGNKNYLFGRNKTNKAIDESNRQVADATAEINKNKPVKTSAPIVSNLYSSQNYNRYSGGNTVTAVGKQGMKLLSREELDAIYAFKKSNVTKLQNGGSILIPEGALHKNKHHIEDVNPELAEDLTKKGIPVVVTDSEGNIEQVAEIESSEIIFEKSLTEKIEALWKDGSDEAAIEAGKLIVDTLFNNCDDNAGLIESVE